MTSFWETLPQPFFILAPMEAVTDVVFRHVVAAAAPPDVWFTEFTNATGWAHAGDKAIGGRLVKTDDENPIVAQLWGADPESMKKLAAHCVELGYQGIDINMGCPDASAVKSGGGAGMIKNPENAAAIISAAKTSGLPVSVKTRLGFSRIDEWQEWLTHILRQDIVNLTIHLRTRKEMSKVDAHFELIPDIKKLRDEIAPQTLLTINGDIRDRQHGMELVEQYGVDGVMIGRGVFANPFAFETNPKEHNREEMIQLLNLQLNLHDYYDEVSRVSRSDEAQGASEERNEPYQQYGEVSTGAGNAAIRRESPARAADAARQGDGVKRARKFDPLKRFFKIYVRDFPNAAELRDQLMHAKTTDEVRSLLAE
jgi:tRNA-dihydrouridine synthase